MPGTNVNVAQAEGDNLFNAFYRVGFFGRCGEVLGRRGPEVDNSLDGRPGFKYLDWQRNVRDRQSFEKNEDKLLCDVGEHALLLL